MSKRTKRRVLAQVLLDSPWQQKELIRSCRRLFTRRGRFFEALVKRILDQFAEPPEYLPLLDFLQQDEPFNDVLESPTFKIKRNVPWKPRMCPVRGNPRQWTLPELLTPLEVARWLGMRPKALSWLAMTSHSDSTDLHGYQQRWIPKRYGARLLEVPGRQIKRIQRQILDRILNRIEPHAAAFGFARGRSLAEMATMHSGKPFCLKMDLAQFFPSVTLRRVCRFFVVGGYPQNVAFLLARLCTTTTPRSVLQSGTVVGRDQRLDTTVFRCAHLPQGSPSSPALANLAAYRLDCRLTGLAEKFGASYSRYADDLVFSGSEGLKRKAKVFQAWVGAVAIEEGFAIRYQKTRFMNSSQSQRAVGLVLNEFPHTSRKEYDSLKAILFNCARFGPASQNRGRRENFRQHLMGRINWVRKFNPKRGAKLQALFEKIGWAE